MIDVIINFNEDSHRFDIIEVDSQDDITNENMTMVDELFEAMEILPQDTPDIERKDEIIRIVSENYDFHAVEVNITGEPKWVV